MTDIFDLLRLIRERVTASGFGVRRIIWMAGDGVRVAVSIPGTEAPPAVWFDEELWEAMASNADAVAQIIDSELARVRLAMGKSRG